MASTINTNVASLTAQRNLGISQGSLERPPAAIQEVLGQLLELRAGELELQMLRTCCIGRNEGQVDLGFHYAGQFDLGLLRRCFFALDGQKKPDKLKLLAGGKCKRMSNCHAKMCSTPLCTLRNAASHFILLFF